MTTTMTRSSQSEMTPLALAIALANDMAPSEWPLAILPPPFVAWPFKAGTVSSFSPFATSAGMAA